MPAKKRAARTVPKPTITVEPNLPPDLPAPTTTRNREPRAQAAFPSRTTRQSTLRSEGKLLLTSHTRPAMQRPASSSPHGELSAGPSTQDSSGFGGSTIHQQEEDGLALHEGTGRAPIVEDVRAASTGPFSTGYLTPLSDAPELPEDTYQEGDDTQFGAASSSSPHAWSAAEDQQPLAGASSSTYISGAKRKRSPSEMLDEYAEEPPTSQELFKKVDKGKGKARAASHTPGDNVTETSNSLNQPHPTSSSQDASGESSSSYTNKGKGKARAAPTSPADPNVLEISDSPVKSLPPPKSSGPAGEPLSSYTCPICFGAPTNATLTPCGHICCGACLFAAVKSTMSRAALSGPVGPGGRPEARCPVCRAVIPHWDGKGRGVIGLQIRATFNV